MTNLIYINKENFSENELLSKIKFLFFEYTFYFDSSDELRRLGYDIGMLLFKKECAISYPKILKNKKYYTIMFRLVLSLPLILIGAYYAQSSDDFLRFIICLGMIVGGLATFVFILSKSELERIDNSCSKFLASITPTNSEFNVDQKLGIKMIDLMPASVNGTEVEDKMNTQFLGFPIELLSELLSPLQDGSLGDKIKMNNIEYQQFLDNLIFGNGINAFCIPKNRKEYFRTFFYNVYDRLNELRFKSEDPTWTKTTFFEKLSGAVEDFRSKNEKSLRVHGERIDFSNKVKKHLTLLSENFYESRFR